MPAAGIMSLEGLEVTQNVAGLEALLRGAEAVHVMEQQIVIISTPDELPPPEGENDTELLLFTTPQPARLETAAVQRPVLERQPVMPPPILSSLLVLAKLGSLPAWHVLLRVWSHTY